MRITVRSAAVLAALALLLTSCPLDVLAAGAEDKAEAAGLYDEAMTVVKESLDQASVRKAVALLEKASQLDPQNEEVWIQLAWRYWLLGDRSPKDSGDQKKARMAQFEKGLAAAEKAQAINKRSVGGLYWRTVNLASHAEMKGILSSLGLAGELFTSMNRVDRRDPYYFYGATRRFGSEVLVRIPTFLSERFGFKPEYVVEDLEMMIERWPNFFPNHTYLARVHVWNGQKDMALKELEFVLSNDPDIMPEEKAENAASQTMARETWKEITNKEYPNR